MGVVSEWRPIKHLPQPDRWLALRIKPCVDVGVVFGFGSNVAWIEIMKRGTSGEA